MPAEILPEFNAYPLGFSKPVFGEGKQKITMAAGGVIFAHNKILLDRADNSDLWSIPGGKPRFSESMEQCVVREAKEELGLKLEIIDPYPYIYYLRREFGEETEHIFMLHYLVRVLPPADMRLGKGIKEFKWEPVTSDFRDAYTNVSAAVNHFLNL